MNKNINRPVSWALGLLYRLLLAYAWVRGPARWRQRVGWVIADMGAISAGMETEEWMDAQFVAIVTAPWWEHVRSRRAVRSGGEAN